jgi:hypothetical protein
MTLQTTQPLDELRLYATNRNANELTRMLADGLMTVDTPYQRPEVWNIGQRRGLIRSMVQGIPVPAIIVNVRDAAHGWTGDDDNVYAVIDGKQRLLTMKAWYGDDFTVPASWFPPEHVETTEDTDDGPYVRYSGLSEVARRRQSIGRFQIPMCKAKLPTVEAEAQVYLIVNGYGTPQTDEDMQRARDVAGGPAARA